MPVNVMSCTARIDMFVEPTIIWSGKMDTGFLERLMTFICERLANDFEAIEVITLSFSLIILIPCDEKQLCSRICKLLCSNPSKVSVLGNNIWHTEETLTPTSRIWTAISKDLIVVTRSGIFPWKTEIDTTGENDLSKTKEPFLHSTTSNKQMHNLGHLRCLNWHSSSSSFWGQSDLLSQTLAWWIQAILLPLHLNMFVQTWCSPQTGSYVSSSPLGQSHLLSQT